MLHLFNTLTRQKEQFVPREAGKVGLYVCGMTVYDLCHIGHARVMVVFDVVARYLRASGYAVTYIRNITDIDDKIIRRAAEHNESIEALTQRYIDEMHADAQALGVLPPTAEPRATMAIDAMIRMIQTLQDKGYAYQADNGDVYYDVSEFDGYGKLSGRQLEELRAGERVAVNEAKADPLDFVLWKSSKAGEPAWPSPWGPGRPGWHIECSAMSAACLGTHFDIHGGGQDLQFPHHENEIAQSEAAHGCQSVNYWMHNGFVRVDEEKMSKSLGNFFTVREVLARYPAEAIRYFILSSHYRSPLNYSEEQLEQAKATLMRFYQSLRALPALEQIAWQTDVEFGQRFQAAMDDDFNTPLALSVLSDVRLSLNKAKEQADQARIHYLACLLVSMAEVLGILQQPADAVLQGDALDAAFSQQVEALILARNAAREKRNWPEADAIRAQLDALGVVLEDRAGHTTWRSV